MWQSLHDAWWRLATQQHPQSFSDALAGSMLLAGSWLYGSAVAVRNLAYDRRWASQASLPCKVVSIGNLTLGGTGKTACAIFIARKLLERKRRVAVLSRGYGGGRPGPYMLEVVSGALRVDGQAPAETAGLADEPQLLASELGGVPVLVDPRRDRSGRTAHERCGADVVVLDDGFQHRRVRRDCDIVLLQAQMPLGGWAMFPRGPMREPMSALRRADVVIITKADERLETVAVIREQVRAINRDAAVLTAAHAPSRLRDPWSNTTSTASPGSESVDRLQGKRVGLVSSIGDPAGFDAVVRRLDAQVVWHETFPDHHPYSAADWDRVRRAAQGQRPDLIITTEKDWVRLRGVAAAPAAGEPPVRVLGVTMTILSGEDLLDARLDRL